MKTKFVVFLLAAVVALGVMAACKGTTDPDSQGNVTFSGTVTSGGSPLAGVQVFLSGDESKNAITDANGAFSFVDLSGDSFAVTPSLRNRAFTPSSYALGSQSRTDLSFAAAAAAYGSVVDQIAADFTAVNQAGQPVSLYSYFGKVVLIDFSADWCGPCRDEAAQAEALYQANKDKGLEMITLLIDGSTSLWASQYGLTFSVLDDDAEALWSIYGEGYVPLNIVLDRNMTIRYKQAGYTKSAIAAVIKEYL